MFSNALNGIVMEECAKCKLCCIAKSDKAEVICGFNAIEEINKGNLSTDLIKSLIIYRVSEKRLDAAAKNWGLYPFANLLRYMSVPKDGYWEYLAIPPGDCPFISPNGCTHPNFKPFECKMYPFYLYKFHFRTDYHCQFADNLEEELKYHEKIGQFIADYLVYSFEHKNDYFNAVQKIKKDYGLPVLTLD